MSERQRRKIEQLAIMYGATPMIATRIVDRPDPRPGERLPRLEGYYQSISQGKKNPEDWAFIIMRTSEDGAGVVVASKPNRSAARPVGEQLPRGWAPTGEASSHGVFMLLPIHFAVQLSNRPMYAETEED